MSASTRSPQTNLAELVGSPEELPLADLATRRNVLKKMQLEKLRDPRNYTHIPNMDLAEKTGKAVYSAWRKVNHRLEP